MFTSGIVVRIKGLVNRQDLNGELGVVDQTENGKTTLALLSTPDVKLAMRSDNLFLAVKCGTCIAYVANEGDLFCAECTRVKRARVDPASSVLDVLAAAALLPARLEPPVPPARARPAAASPATHNPPESPAPVAQAPVVQVPVAQPPANVQAPVVEAPVVQAPVVQAPVVQAPVVQAPIALASPVLEQTELEERIVQMLDSDGVLLPECTDELEGLLRRVVRDRKSVSFKFLYRLNYCYQKIHIGHVRALLKRPLHCLLDQPIDEHLQRLDRLTEIVQEQFPFFKKMLEIDKLYLLNNNGFVPEAKFRSKLETLYGQIADICHQHLVDGENLDFANHLFFLYSFTLDREIFTRFFQSDSRFPDEIGLYCSMSTIAVVCTKNIYSMFGRTISGGIQNKLAIFKAVSETVPHTMTDYDAAVVGLLESIEGPIERTFAISKKLLDEKLISEKHFEFVVDKMFA